MSTPPPHATRVTRWALRPVEAVYDTIADPETYPVWLVGCRAIRSVDADWLREGAHFHHRVGLVGPVAVNDSSKAVEVERPSHLALEVRFRPAGRGRVDFWLSNDPSPDGSVRTRIDMDEAPIGPLSPLAPVLSPLIEGRNQRRSTASWPTSTNIPVARPVSMPSRSAPTGPTGRNGT